MRRFTLFRMGFLGVVTCLVLVFGMALSTGTVSAHTASAHTPASTQMASWGCCGGCEEECGGCEEECGFDQCDPEFFDCGFNRCDFDCGFGDNFCNFDNCFSSCNENGCIFIPHHIFRHHRFFHHRCFFNDFECF